MLVLILGILAVFAIAFVYANLGMGGGILYVPVLFYVLGSDLFNFAESELHHIVVPISLAMVCANATAALINHNKKGFVDWKLGGMMALGGVIGSVIGALFNLESSREVFYLLFLAVVVVAIGKLLIDWLRKKEGLDSDNDSLVTKERIAASVVIAIGAGFIAGALGIGGGVINVPVLMYILGRSTKKAAGTSFLIIIAYCVVGISTYAASGSHIDVPMILLLAPLIFAAGFLGSRFGLKKLKGRTVRLMFIMVLLIAVAKISFDFLNV